MEKINKFLFENHGDVAATMNKELVWMTFPKALRLLSVAGMLVAFANIWLVVNLAWIHWPAAYILILGSLIFLAFMSIMMNTASTMSVVQVIMWIGFMYTLIGQLFILLHWPGGTAMLAYGIPNIIVICAAIAYLIHLPKEYQWARKTLGWWIIGTQVVIALLWYIVQWYGLYSVDQFEPAIPYAESSIISMQQWRWDRTARCLGLGVTLLGFSLPLYIVARKHSK